MRASESLQTAQLIASTLRDVLVDDHTVSMVIKGSSMLPLLVDGDRVWLKHITWPDLSIGDILVFEQGHSMFTHRLVYKTPDQLITKGDNLFYFDALVQPDDVIGKVVAFERAGKRYPIESKHRAAKLLIGYGHFWVGAVGNQLLKLARWKNGKLKRPLFWLGKGVLIPIQLLERMLLHVG